MADKKKKSEKKDSAKIVKQDIKTPTVSKAKGAKISQVSSKIKVEKTTALEKKVTRKSVKIPTKSVEQEVKEAVIAVGHKAQEIGTSALKKIQKTAKNVDVRDVVQDVEDAGKKAFSQAKKTAQKVKNSDIVHDTLLKGESLFVRIKKGFSFNNPQKTLTSTLKSGKGAITELTHKVTGSTQKTRTHTILGVEMNDKVFRSLVLTLMLAIFFFFGMHLGKMSAYNHIRYKMEKYERQQQVQEMYQKDMQEQNIQLLPNTINPIIVSPVVDSEISSPPLPVDQTEPVLPVETEVLPVDIIIPDISTPQ